MKEAVKALANKVKKYTVEIEDRKRRILHMKKVLDNYNSLYSKSDNELRVSASNQRIENPDGFFPGPVSAFEDDENIRKTLTFGSDQMKAFHDPLVDSILRLYDENSDAFREENMYDCEILHRIINRTMHKKEYLGLVSGIRAFSRVNGKDVFLPEPPNLTELLEEYGRSHTEVYPP